MVRLAENRSVVAWFDPVRCVSARYGVVRVKQSLFASILPASLQMMGQHNVPE